jgi:hypothetical protein
MRVRVTAVLVALAVHGVLFVGFMLQPQVAVVQEPLTAIEVELVRQSPQPRRIHGRGPPAKATNQPFKPATAVHVTPSNGARAAAKSVLIPRDTTVGVSHDQLGIEAGLASALRTSVGCSSASFLHLSPSEQQACERLRKNQRATIGTSEFGVDPSKKAMLDEAKSRDAFLEHPFAGIKGLEHCRPHTGTGPAGDSGGTISLNCSIPF